MDYIEFNKINNNIYIKNDKLQFIIIPDCIFETNGIITFPNSKTQAIILSINKNKEDHKKFIDIIKNIYDKCSEFIENENDFNPDVIINPLKNINDTIYNLQICITNWDGKIITNFYNIINDELIDLEELKNKVFSIYPAMQIDRISLNPLTNNAYINIQLKEAYICNIKNRKLLDYKKACIAFNKIKE